MVEVDQVVHGYADGHRQLAASIALPAEARRRLAAQTDATFGLEVERLLAFAPVAETQLFALSAIWPAPESLRPGSVWAHSLLFDVDALHNLSGLGGLLPALARPANGDDFEHYRQRAAIEDFAAKIKPADEPALDAILLALYGWPEHPVRVVCEDLASAERALMVALEQQWPALRRTTTFRSRVRGGDDASPVLELARTAPRHAKTQRLQLSVPLATEQVRPAWLDTLAADARLPGTVRRVLRDFGPAGSRGRAEVPPLTRVAATLPSPEQAVAALAAAFPDEDQMTPLKLGLLGSADHLWQVSEADRVRLAVEHAPSLPWRKLELAERTVQQAADDPQLGAQLLVASRQAPKELRDGMVLSISRLAKPEVVSRLAEVDVPLAAELSRVGPDVLARPELWAAAADWQIRLVRCLAESTYNTGAGARLLARGLLAAERTDLARIAIEAHTIEVNVMTDALIAAIADTGRVGRAQLRLWQEVLGAQASATAAAASDQGWPVIAIALAGEGGQRIAAELPKYLDAVAVESLDRVDEPVALVIEVRLLAANMTAGGDRKTIAATFAPVHRALVQGRLPDSLCRELERTLPEGNHRDRAERLRAGLLRRIRKDRWGPEDVARAVRDAGPEAWRLAEQAQGKKGDITGVLEEAWARLRWGWPF